MSKTVSLSLQTPKFPHPPENQYLLQFLSTYSIRYVRTYNPFKTKHTGEMAPAFFCPSFLSVHNVTWSHSRSADQTLHPSFSQQFN